MTKRNSVNVANVKWSHPMGLKELSQIFDVHRNTMSKWLKEQTICNRHLSPRRWEVAVFELPYDLNIDSLELSSQIDENDFS